MSVMQRPAPTSVTHEVTNQVPPLAPLQPVHDHPPWSRPLEREGGGWARERAERGRRGLGRRAAGRWGVQANENPPKLQHPRPLRPPHRRGRVPPGVAPAHGAGLRARPPRAAVDDGPRRRPRRARRARASTTAQVEAGHGCPMTMTFAAVPALRDDARARGRVGAAADRRGLRRRAAPRRREGQREVRHGDDREAGRLRRARQHDHAPRRVAAASTCSTATSGSAARRCATCSSSWRRPTRASPASPSRGSCPTARATPFQLQRLKDKLGNRSNASPEVEFDGTWGRLVGEPGRGVPTIIEMVGHTRLDCVHRLRRRDARGRRQRPGTPRTAARSAGCWPTSR